ncbi:MAG: cytochrome c-type biogenesis protein, partial [Pseudomonadota bacterium]|nr:cytochrome c-type biogenesis protein [Pseudomonadota bacterium]
FDWRSRLMRIVFAFVLIFGLAGHALADDAAMREIASDLRCMVCSGESIADSESDFAIAVREHISERLNAGADAKTIRTELASTYGDAILMRPPFAPGTWALWLGPVLFLLIGAWLVLIGPVRKRGLGREDAAREIAALEEEEHQAS